MIDSKYIMLYLKVYAYTFDMLLFRLSSFVIYCAYSELNHITTSITDTGWHVKTTTKLTALTSK